MEQSLNTATIAIPERWQPATARIKRFLERRTASYGLPVTIVLTTGQFDSGQIWLMKDTLTENERLAVQTTISRLSNRLNANLSKDAWQAAHQDDAEEEEEARIIAALLRGQD